MGETVIPCSDCIVSRTICQVYLSYSHGSALHENPEAVPAREGDRRVHRKPRELLDLCGRRGSRDGVQLPRRRWKFSEPEPLGVHRASASRAGGTGGGTAAARARGQGVGRAARPVIDLLPRDEGSGAGEMVLSGRAGGRHGRKIEERGANRGAWGAARMVRPAAGPD